MTPTLSWPSIHPKLLFESLIPIALFRLSRLYDAVETGKVSLDDLAPRIKEQRAREGELSKMRLMVEAEMLVQGPNHVDAETIKTHAKGLKAILEDADLVTSKAFLKTFIKRIEIKGNEALIRYTLPLPTHGRTTDRVSVLPIETPSGDGVTIGRTFELIFSLTI